MRRKEKEITDRFEMESILQKAAVCRLGMVADNGPYVVPLCFGYRDGILFFHSAARGMKIDILQRDPRVCFEVDIDTEAVRGEVPCRWGMRFRSVIGFGIAEFVSDPEEKARALDAVMSHYGEAGEVFQYPEGNVDTTAVFKVKVESMSGKTS